MVFCGYCGKSFKRTEHLERHIPRHTNVKPHRCSSCQLSFARRDLLKRHYSIYHEVKDSIEPFPGGLPEWRTPIACENCARAKSGCDKAVPCQRCADKNIECVPRFARRFSKAAAARAIKAAVSREHEDTPGNGVAVTLNTSRVDSNSPKQSSTSPPPDPCSQGGFVQETSSLPCHPDFHNMLLDDAIPLSNNFLAHDFPMWPDYSQDMPILDTLHLAQPGTSILAHSEFSDQSSTSDLISSSPCSSHGTSHSRFASTASLEDFESSLKLEAASRRSSVGVIPAPEFEAVMAAEAAWPLARCGPLIFSGACPQTAIIHLECLEQNSKHEGSWILIEAHLDNIIGKENAPAHSTSITPITSRTRDQMLAVTQSFLRKALEMHRGSAGETPDKGKVKFVVLPPNKILEYFLRSYTDSLSQFYSLVAHCCVNPNEMLLSNSQASTLLLLLMVAQGAAKVPTTEARYLSAGLTEMCRISLCDIVDKNVEISSDSAALRCALLLCILSAWSGDKWLMDFALGRRVAFLSMLKQAGILAPQQILVPTLGNSEISELQWQAWVHQEEQSRLAYNWIMLDHELSLLYDVVPALSVSELQCPLPGPEALWRAPNSEKWREALAANPQCQQAAFSPRQSLYDLFQEFLHDDQLALRKDTLTTYQLRLLLYPLHSLVYHFGQMHSCLYSPGLRRVSSQAETIATASMMLHLEETQALLQRWYNIAVTVPADSSCTVSSVNFVLYHLLVLNTAASVPDAESAARGDGNAVQFSSGGGIPLHFRRSIRRSRDAVVHSGQVLRHLAAMRAEHASLLPCWWSAALYRAVLVLWANAMNSGATGTATPMAVAAQAPGRQSAQFKVLPTKAPFSPAAKPIAIDRIPLEDPAAVRLWNGGAEGDDIPVLTRSDGSSVPIDNPGAILAYGIDMLGTDESGSRLGGGIARKLAALGVRWRQLECNDGGV